MKMPGGADVCQAYILRVGPTSISATGQLRIYGLFTPQNMANLVVFIATQQHAGKDIV